MLLSDSEDFQEQMKQTKCEDNCMLIHCQTCDTAYMILYHVWLGCDNRVKCELPLKWYAYVSSRESIDAVKGKEIDWR